MLVPAGQFTMGATPEQQEEVLDFGWPDHWLQHMDPLVKSAGPSHQVYLDAFFIDIHEVSNQDYANFVDATGHRLPVHHPPHRQLANSLLSVAHLDPQCGEG